MEFRRFEDRNMMASLLGFGVMRLPTTTDGPKDIDREEAIKMIRYAIDNGVNYIDTAWVYHQGESEIVTGLALQDGYREKVSIATKNPTWLIKKDEDWDKYLDMQLQKLQTDCIDFYLQHSLDREEWANVKEFNMWEKGIAAKKAGKIKYYGFSFHDDLSLFKEIINEYPWDFCQIQLNYLNENYQAGLEGLKIAKEKNIPVIIMEPLRGGLLASKLPQIAKEMISNCAISYTPVEWAFKYLANLDGILTILSGMSTMEQVEDNVRIFSSECAKEKNMTKEETEFINNLIKVWESNAYINCTDCKYCIPCPSNVNIPECFRVYNELKEDRFNGMDLVNAGYRKLIATNADPNKCIKCGACEQVCPQKIDIIKRLNEITEVFKEEN